MVYTRPVNAKFAAEAEVICLKFTLIFFVQYSFSHVPLPYNTFHVSLKGCSQIIEIGTVEESKWERKFVLWPTISIR